jgi:trk system potassium uptake protein TrkA
LKSRRQLVRQDYRWDLPRSLVRRGKYIIARATTEIQQEILFRIGADEVILPEKQSAAHLAARISIPNILEYLELDKGIHLTEIHVDQSLAGKTLVELSLR